MKRLLFIAFSLMFCVCSFMHAGDNCLKDSTYVTDLETGLMERTINQYDNSLLVSAQVEYYEPTTSRWIGKTKETYTYEGKNRTHIDMYEWNQDEGQWEYAYAVSYKYEDGLKVEYILTSKGNGADYNLSRLTWKYDAYYRMTEEMMYTNNQNEWRNYQKTEYTYASGTTTAIYYSWQNNSVWEPQSKAVSVMNAFGKTDTHESYSRHNDDWKIGYSVRCHYDSDGKIIEQTTFFNRSLAEITGDEQSYPHQKITYQYDAEGRLASKTSYCTYVEHRDPGTREEYTWDSLSNNIGMSIWKYKGEEQPWEKIQQTDNYFSCYTPEIPTYTLSAISDNYILGNVLGGGTYAEGEEVQLMVVPYPGGSFTGWDFTDSDELTVTFIMPACDTTVVASFVQLHDALPSIQTTKETNVTPYNILGQSVDETYHGIVIQNGKKRVQ